MQLFHTFFCTLYFTTCSVTFRKVKLHFFLPLENVSIIKKTVEIKI